MVYFKQHKLPETFFRQLFCVFQQHKIVDKSPQIATYPHDKAVFRYNVKVYRLNKQQQR